MHIGKIVLEKLKYEGKTQMWLAEKLNIPKSTLSGKLKADTLTAIELIKIDLLIDLKYEMIKRKVEEEMNNDLITISDWISQGNISGYYPEWILSFEDKNSNKVDFRDVDSKIFELISNAVSEGLKSGIINDIKWTLDIE